MRAPSEMSHQNTPVHFPIKELFYTLWTPSDTIIYKIADSQRYSGDICIKWMWQGTEQVSRWRAEFGESLIEITNTQVGEKTPKITTFWLFGARRHW